MHPQDAQCTPSWVLLLTTAAFIGISWQSSGISSNPGPTPSTPSLAPFLGSFQPLITLSYQGAPRHLPTCTCCRRNLTGQPPSAPAGCSKAASAYFNLEAGL